jgi:pimeloyl-ACP methyl ester carboxylesterase
LHYILRSNRSGKQDEQSGSGAAAASKPEQDKREIAGDGDDVAVVFIADHGQTSEMIEPLVRSLVNDFAGSPIRLRALAYDRPGYSYSPTMSTPRHAKNGAIELNDLLENVLGENNQQGQQAGGKKMPKIVLVSNGFGTHISRLYYDHYPERIKGLVFIDPVHEKHHVQSIEWRKATDQERGKLTTFKIYNKVGMLEVLLNFEPFYLSRHVLSTLGLPKPIDRAESITQDVPDKEGNVAELRDDTRWSRVQQYAHFNLRREFFLDSWFAESAISIYSSKQAFESQKDPEVLKNYERNNIPIAVIRAAAVDPGSAREAYKDWEEKAMPAVVQDLSQLSKHGKTTYSEALRFNHNNVYRSQLVKSTIAQMVRGNKEQQPKQ